MGQAQSTQQRPPKDIPVNKTRNGDLQPPPDWKPAGGVFQPVSPSSDLSNPSQFRHRLPDPSRRALERHRTSKVCSTAVPSHNRHRRRSHSLPPPTRFSFSQPTPQHKQPVVEPRHRMVVADLGIFPQESRDESDKPVIQVDSREEPERCDKPLRQWRIFKAKASAAKSVMAECWKDRSHQVKQVVEAAVEPCIRPDNDSRVADALLLADSKKKVSQTEPPMAAPLPYVQLEPSNRNSMPPSKFEPIWRETGNDSPSGDRLVYLHSQETWVHRLSGEKDSISPLKHSPVPADPTIRQHLSQDVLLTHAPAGEVMKSPVANLFDGDEDEKDNSVASSPYDERHSLSATDLRMSSPPAVLSVGSNTSTPLELKYAHPIRGSTDTSVTLPAGKRLSMGTVSTRQSARSSSDTVATRPTVRDLDKTAYAPPTVTETRSSVGSSSTRVKESSPLASLENLPARQSIDTKSRESIESRSRGSYETSSTRRASQSRGPRLSMESQSEMSAETASTRRASQSRGPIEPQFRASPESQSQLSAEAASTLQAPQSGVSVESVPIENLTEPTSAAKVAVKAEVPNQERRPMARVASIAKMPSEAPLDTKRLSIQEDMQRQIDAQLRSKPAEANGEDAAAPQGTRVQRLRQQYQRQLQRLSNAASKRRSVSAPRSRQSGVSTNQTSNKSIRRRRSASVPRQRQAQSTKPTTVETVKPPAPTRELAVPVKETSNVKKTESIDNEAIAKELKDARDRLQNYEQRQKQVTSTATILQQTFPLAKVFSSDEEEKKEADNMDHLASTALRHAMMSPDADKKTGDSALFSPALTVGSLMSQSSAPMVSNQALSNAAFLFSPSYAGGDEKLLRIEPQPVQQSEGRGTVSITTLDSRSRLSLRSEGITIPICRTESLEGPPRDDASERRVVRFSDVHEVISTSRESSAHSSHSGVEQPKIVEIPAIESKLSDLTDTASFRPIRESLLMNAEETNFGDMVSVVSEESARQPVAAKKLSSRPTPASTLKWSYSMEGEMATGVTPLRSGKSTGNGTNSPYIRFKEAKKRFSGIMVTKEAPAKKQSPVKRSKGGLVHSRIVAMEDRLAAPRRSSIGRRSSVSMKAASPVKRGSPTKRISMSRSASVNPRDSIGAPVFRRSVNTTPTEPIHLSKKPSPAARVVQPLSVPVWARRQSVESLITTTQESIDLAPFKRESVESSPRGLAHVASYVSAPTVQGESVGSSPRGLAHIPSYDSGFTTQRDSMKSSHRGSECVQTQNLVVDVASDCETVDTDDPFGEIMMAASAGEAPSDPEESPVNLYEMHRAAMEDSPSEAGDDFEKLLQYQGEEEEDDESYDDETVSTIKQDKGPSLGTTYSSYRLSGGNFNKNRASMSSSVAVSISTNGRNYRESMGSIGESTTCSTVIASRSAALPFRSNSGPVKPTEQMHRVVPGAPSQYNPTQPAKWRALAAAAQKKDSNRTFGSKRLAVRNPNIVGH